jgi:ribosome-associated protein
MINGLKYRKDLILSEINFETSRSSGKGGQHVNKTESRVTLVFDLMNSTSFSEQEKTRLSNYLKNRLSKGVLRMSAQDSRSQSRNKEVVVNRFFDLLAKGLVVQKKRKPSKVPKSKIEERLKKKRIHKERKANRRGPDIRDYR